MGDRNKILFYITIITLVAEGAFEMTNIKNKLLNKRYEMDFPTCVENFDIHTDTIIRAQDSKAIGGRYINETEVSSRDECLKLCCQTSLCDVFIFEEKSPGSCYLFDCGSSDDFKCKFNPHRHYTSGIMAMNRHVAELESQIQLSKHEEELASLRRNLATLVLHTTTLPTPVTLTTSTLKPSSTSEHANVSTSTAGRKCSRYQFECRTSGECIAIYNACDGIPQCTDGSDEGPELACPSPASTIPPPVPSALVPKQSGQPEGPQTFNPQFRQQPSQQQPVWPPVWQQQQQQQFPAVENAPKSAEFAQQSPPLLPPQRLNSPQGYQQPVQLPPASPETRKYYNHDGEYGSAHDTAAQWPPQQFHNSGPINPIPQTYHRSGAYPGAEYEDPPNSHIFNHKGSPLLNDMDIGSSNYGGYGAAEGKTGSSYYNGAVPAAYHQPQQQQQQQQWPHPRTQEHETHSVEDESRLGSHARFGAVPLQPPSQQQQVPAAPDYYNYEEGGTQQRGSFHHHLNAQTPVATESKQELKAQQYRPPALMEGQSESAAMAEVSKPSLEKQKEPALAVPAQRDVTAESTTIHPLEEAHSHGHYTGEGSKKKALPPHMPSPLDLEVVQIPDGAAAKPGGAYLSLTVGMTVTALLIILISCRFRFVRRRLHRGGGKSPYAHDADFLVNGMYL